MSRDNGNSFIVQIDNSKDSVWTGKIIWIHQNKSQSFRSALELIKLIDSTMTRASDENRAAT